MRLCTVANSTEITSLFSDIFLSYYNNDNIYSSVKQIVNLCTIHRGIQYIVNSEDLY